MHHHRVEHWIVVKGTAEVTNGTKYCCLGKSIDLPTAGACTSAEESRGVAALEIIEVQSEVTWVKTILFDLRTPTGEGSLSSRARGLNSMVPVLPMLRALWGYRSFIWSSVLREFHGKYRESLLGAFWSVANPLAMIVVYTVVFGQLMRPQLAGHERTPFAFSIYLCAGVITWGLFGEMLGD